MSESKLNLSEEVRTQRREKFNTMKTQKYEDKILKLRYHVYLLAGKSNIGRNRAKRLKVSNEENN